MRSRAAGALAVVVLCACAAQDKVLTPDEVEGGVDAAVVRDSGAPSGSGGQSDSSVSAVVIPDATSGVDASGSSGMNDSGVSADAAPGADAASGGSDAGSGAHVAKDPDCDLNGVWIARQNTASEAVGIPLSQFANNWYYLEFAQDGEQVVVSKHMDCGCTVLGDLGSAQVELSPATMRALIPHNRQVGRKGSFAKQPDGTCAFQMEKFWSVRGVNEETYTPKPRNRDVSIEQLRSDNPLPQPMTTGIEDWDGDGQPGIAWQVGGLAIGTRHSGQRDWTRWFSAPGYQVMATANFGTLVVRADFANEEVVYATDPADSFTLGALSEPDGSAPHAITLRFLGRTRDDPRAQAIVKPDDFDTCLAIQADLGAITGLK